MGHVLGLQTATSRSKSDAGPASVNPVSSVSVSVCSLSWASVVLCLG